MAQGAFNYAQLVIRGIKNHFSDFWNWVDTIMLILSFTMIINWILFIDYQRKNIKTLSEEELNDPNTMKVFHESSEMLVVYLNVCSFNLVLIFMKVLRLDPLCHYVLGTWRCGSLA